jgi:hypothetical protein
MCPPAPKSDLLGYRAAYFANAQDYNRKNGPEKQFFKAGWRRLPPDGVRLHPQAERGDVPKFLRNQDARLIMAAYLPTCLLEQSIRLHLPHGKCVFARSFISKKANS